MVENFKLVIAFEFDKMAELKYGETDDWLDNLKLDFLPIDILQ